LRLSKLVEKARGPKPADAGAGDERLYAEIGRLKVELDWLKNGVRAEPVSVRRGWIEPGGGGRGVGGLAVSRQCALAGVSRLWAYAPAAPEADARDLALLRLIDEQYTRRPFFGSRRMVVHLREQGHAVNRKHVQRLMRVLGLAGMAPGPATSRPHPQHKVYPYLLRGVSVVRPNQMWSTDITCIRLEEGFAYLMPRPDSAWHRDMTVARVSFAESALSDLTGRHIREEP
jgi:putative transposase